MGNILSWLIRPGKKTSEFALTIVGSILALFWPVLDRIIESVAGGLSMSPIGAIVAAGLVAVYTAARAYIKGKGVEAIMKPGAPPPEALDTPPAARIVPGTYETTPSGNVVGPTDPTVVDWEREHKLRP